MSGEALTARWVTGDLVLTVTCEHGRMWVHPADPIGDRPLPHFLEATRWTVCPGSEWQEDGGVWTVRVMPQSPHDAAVLFTPGNPPVPSGLVDVNQLDLLSQR